GASPRLARRGRASGWVHRRQPDVAGGCVFVGRKREFEVLQAAFDDAAAGEVAAVTVAGEPGIGKSALLGRFAASVSEQGAVVARGRGWDGGGAPPFRAWVDVLDHLRASDMMLDEELDQLLEVEQGLTLGGEGVELELEGAERARL